MDENFLKLVFVNPYCKNSDGTFEYDLFFSETPDVVWGVDWDYNNPSVCENLLPEESTYSNVYRIKTTVPFKTIRENSCFSMSYATYGMIALSWINIDLLDEYPENGRCTLHFGDSIELVREILSKNQIYF